MKTIEVNKLHKLNELNEMTGCLCHYAINTNFYDYFGTKELSWLLDNEERIKEDFYNNIDKMKFDIILNTKHIDIRINLILNINNIEEFTTYVHIAPFNFLKKRAQNRIIKMYNKFINLKYDYEKIKYFDEICRK